MSKIKTALLASAFFGTIVVAICFMLGKADLWTGAVTPYVIMFLVFSAYAIVKRHRQPMREVIK